MNRGFVRLVWGDCSKNGLRNGKLLKDIQQSLSTENFDFTVYVLGEENFQHLSQLDLTCILVDKKPLLYDVETQQYAHKLHLLGRAMSDHDEMVYLDWDCRAISDITDTFWEVLNKKDTFQSNLIQYRTKKCLWRDDEKRKTCNGGFLYMRDKSIPSILIKNYNDLVTWVVEQDAKRKERGKELRFRERSLIFDDEPAISKYVDGLSNGWQGLEYYWDHFEPEVCMLHKKSAYGERDRDKEHVCFSHWHKS